METMAVFPAKKRKLSPRMTLRAFENGYWYAAELREFATKMRIPFATKLRKDQLETAIKDLLFADGTKVEAISVAPKRGQRDVDRGLHLDLPVVHYTSNKETKSFIEREAAKIQPGFKRASGSRYLLNRWREEQIAAGRRITYRDLVLQAIAWCATFLRHPADVPGAQAFCVLLDAVTCQAGCGIGEDR